MSALAPAANPCGSCPYRRDVPSGVFIHRTQRQAFVDWLAEHRLEVFPIPHAGEDGELVLEARR